VFSRVRGCGTSRTATGFRHRSPSFTGGSECLISADGLFARLRMQTPAVACLHQSPDPAALLLSEYVQPETGPVGGCRTANSGVGRW